MSEKEKYFFTRIKSDTGISMMMANEREGFDPDKPFEMMMFYMEDVNEETNSGTVGECFFEGIVENTDEVIWVLYEVVFLFKFKYIDVWFNVDKPQRLHRIGNGIVLPKFDT